MIFNKSKDNNNPFLRKYKEKKRDIIVNILKCLSVSSFAIYILFFKWYFIIGALLILPVYMQKIKSKVINDLKNEFKVHFSDALEVLCISLESGKAVENAFKDVVDEMKVLHGKDAIIVLELSLIISDLKNGVSVEDCLIKFADRCDIDIIKEYAKVFMLSKRTDGNLIKISEHTINMIRNEYETRLEIITSITKRCGEIRIMQLMPFIMMLYLRVMSPGFFDNVDNNIAGVLAIFVLLLVYGAICVWINYILNKVDEGVMIY